MYTKISHGKNDSIWYNSKKRQTANQIVGSEINKNQLDDIILVDNSNLDNPDLLYVVKHLNKNSGIKILATNIKNAI